jgi:hypothetical protein
MKIACQTIAIKISVSRTLGLQANASLINKGQIDRVSMLSMLRVVTSATMGFISDRVIVHKRSVDSTTIPQVIGMQYTKDAVEMGRLGITKIVDIMGLHRLD